MKERKKVIIIGAGFGGLQAVKKLSGYKNIEIALIDRKNHHLFQPLLYQVATAVLSPADISIPSRSLMQRKKNVTVLMDQVTSIDTDMKEIILSDKRILYDYLIIAAGARTGYFGKSEFMKHSLGLKNLRDALRIRNRLLMSFEQAENHPEKADKLLKFIIIGGGPTGIELAGSIAELSHNIINDDFRNINTRKAEILLIEAGSDLIPTFNRELSVYTKQKLEKRNVKVLLNTRVVKIEPEKVYVKGLDGERKFEASLILWTAGVEAVPLALKTGLPISRSNRFKVNKYCSFDNHPEIFAIGDIAEFKNEDGKILPGVSAVAMQQGRYVARSVIREIKGNPRKPFRYFNKGNMATIGRKDAVAELGRLKFTGFTGWIMWLFVHLFYQVGFKNKISILITWIWSYITFGATARVIQEPISDDKSI